jgi:Tfp pilus assembly protein PilN
MTDEIRRQILDVAQSGRSVRLMGAVKCFDQISQLAVRLSSSRLLQRVEADGQDVVVSFATTVVESPPRR